MKKGALYRSIPPRILLVVDCLGAAISFVLLAFVLTAYQSNFGIPTTVLWSLAIPPAFFFLFDLFALMFLRKKFGSVLRTIAVFNAIYCITSLGLAIVHASSIMLLGWCYILGEIVLVMTLAIFEWKSARSAEQC